MRPNLMLPILALLPLLADAATISGTVTDADSGLPIEGATVSVTDINAYFGQGLDLVVTDAAGSYSIELTVDPAGTPTGRFAGGPPAVVLGEVLLEVVAPANAPMRAGDTLGQVDCFFFCELDINSEPDLTGAITIADSDTLTQNFALDAGARLSGMITADGGGPLEGVPLTFFTQEPFEQVSAISFSTRSDASGNYVSASAVKPGTYFLGAGEGSFTDAPPSYGNFVSQAFGGFTCEFLSCVVAASTPVSVVGTTDVTGLDFVLTPGGEVAGQVIYADTGLPLADPDFSQIRVYTPDDGRLLAQFPVRSDRFGPTFDSSFRITGLSGSYILEIDPSPSLETNLIRVLNDGQYCPFAGCERGQGVPITVLPGSPVNRDFALSRGGKLTGTVTDMATGMAIEGSGFTTAITILDAAGNVAGGGLIDGDGRITSADGIPAGDYRVATGERFLGNTISSVPGTTLSAIPYVDQVYLGVDCQGLACNLAAATDVTLTAGTVVSNIDFSLSTGFRISGIVTAADDGTPLAGRNVEIFNTSGQRVGLEITDAAGAYVTGGLPAGDYRIVVKDGGRVILGSFGATGLGYFGQVFGAADSCVQDLCSPASGSNITITSADVTGIDIQLASGPTISGQVIDTALGLPVRLTVDVFNSGGVRVGAWSTVTTPDASYTTGALTPGTYDLVPRITRTYSIGSPATVAKGGSTIAGTLTIEITDTDVADARLGVFPSLVFASGFETN